MPFVPRTYEYYRNVQRENEGTAQRLATADQQRAVSEAKVKPKPIAVQTKTKSKALTPLPSMPAVAPSPNAPIPQIVDTTREQYLKGFNDISSLQAQLTPQLQSLGNLLRPSATNPNLPQILDVANNPALDAQIRAAIRPLGQQFQDVTIPGIRGDFLTGGQFGGTRQGIAEGLAGKELIQQSGDIAGRLSGESYAQGLAALTQGATSAGELLSKLIQLQELGVSLGPQTAQLQTLPSDILSKVDLNRRLESSGAIDTVTQRIVADLLGPLGLAQAGLSTASGLAPSSTTSTGTSSGGGPSQLNQSLSGIAGGAALGATAGAGAAVATGAAVGTSAFPGVGTAIGAALGLILSFV